LCLLAGCVDKPVGPAPITSSGLLPVREVRVTPDTIAVFVGTAASLRGDVVAEASVTERRVIWSSSDSTVAVVSTEGVVTGVRPGATFITAAAMADPTVRDRSTVLVFARPPFSSFVATRRDGR
jgi:hypothetical protein